MGDGLYFMTDLAGLINEDKSSPEKLEDGETYRVDIPIFREGRFEHRWYGELDFDKEYLQGLLANFKAGVYAQKISFDVSHEPDKGAIAWIEDTDNGVFIQDKIFSTPFGTKSLSVLYARAELTPEGYQLLKSKKFRYFSSEIHPDYSTNEKHSLGEQGEVVVRHGPTLIGGGLTNRPFIPGLGEIELSDAGGDDGVLDYKFSDRDTVEGSFLFMRGLKEPVPAKDEVIINNEAAPKESGVVKDIEPIALSVKGVFMKFSELLEQVEKFSTPKEQVEYMNSVRGSVAVEDNAVFSIVLKAKESAAQSAAQAEDAIQRKVAAETEAQSIKAVNVKLSNDLAEAKEGSWQSQVKLYCEDLHKQKHHASAINAVEKILLSMKKDHREFKFSVAEGEASKELQVLDLFTAVFSSLPMSARLNEEELTSANTAVEVHPNAPSDKAKAEKEAKIVELSESSAKTAAESDLEVRIQKFTAIHGYAPPAGIVSKIDGFGYIV